MVEGEIMPIAGGTCIIDDIVEDRIQFGHRICC